MCPTMALCNTNQKCNPVPGVRMCVVLSLMPKAWCTHRGVGTVRGVCVGNTLVWYQGEMFVCVVQSTLVLISSSNFNLR